MPRAVDIAYQKLEIDPNSDKTFWGLLFKTVVHLSCENSLNSSLGLAQEANPAITAQVLEID